MTPTCRWNKAAGERQLPDRHLAACDGKHCAGCQPCPDQHCTSCRKRHTLDRICPTCLGEVREILVDIVHLSAQLLPHALAGGDHGKLEAARPIPGGDAMVLLGPASLGDERKAAHAALFAEAQAQGLTEQAAWAWASKRVGDDEIAGDPIHTANLLKGWERDWSKYAGVPRTVGQHLDWAAQHHPAFSDFVSEIRDHRTYLENLVHDGVRTDLGAPCPKCQRPLEKVWADGDDANEEDDRWWCPRCKVSRKPGEYVHVVTAGYRQHAAWLTAPEIEATYRVNISTLRNWASSSRGHVARRYDRRARRTVYSTADVERMRDSQPATSTNS